LRDIALHELFLEDGVLTYDEVLIALFQLVLEVDEGVLEQHAFFVTELIVAVPELIGEFGKVFKVLKVDVLISSGVDLEYSLLVQEFRLH